MTHDQQKDLGKFFLVGVVSTIFDYVLLNIFIGILGLPLLVANSVSAPFSSYLSYKLNKRVVFEDRMYGKRKTLLLYVSILGFGILVIQNSLLHVFNNTIAQTLAEIVQPYVSLLNLELSTSILSANISKIGASLIAALWNFFMLRRFVFVTSEDKIT